MKINRVSILVFSKSFLKKKMFKPPTIGGFFEGKQNNE